MTNPAAFLSYTRFDDENDNGAISNLRNKLEGEIRAQTGEQFQIFQDRNDIAWGQNWEKRIVKEISTSTFLIPIITPNFFISPMCRDEFNRFLAREKLLGRSDLIFPIYYITCDDAVNSSDEILQIVHTRQWADWRKLRHSNLARTSVRVYLSKMAQDIKKAIKETRALKESEHRSIKIGQKVTEAKKTSEAASVKIIAKDGLPSVKLYSELSTSDRRLPFQSRPYCAYSKRFDEVVPALGLATAEELGNLNKLMKDKQKKILGVFDGSNLLTEFLHRKKKKNIALTFLIDTSGSMRGIPILTVAAWVKAIVEILSLIDVKVEVLGFTTRAWRGGQSRELWIKDGKPPRPGRLNDLRHIVYKEFGESFSSSSQNYGLMLLEGLTKENLDGEALLWAHQRLSTIAADKRYLVLLSDGAPVDDSTLSANPPNYLADHFQRVCTWIQRANTCHLYGVSIGHKFLDQTIPRRFESKRTDQFGPALIKCTKSILSN